MGVDKKNVGLVVHYEISDSLENYVQELVEPGVTNQLRRIVTFFSIEEDLDKHFYLLKPDQTAY